jgi:hypothetical protein
VTEEAGSPLIHAWDGFRVKLLKAVAVNCLYSDLILSTLSAFFLQIKEKQIADEGTRTAGLLITSELFLLDDSVLHST